jgi:thiol-disulfide isomerase/thioredoxin
VEIEQIIKNNPKFVVMLWDDNCPYCTEFKPIFQAVCAETPEVMHALLKMPRNEENEFRDKYKLDKSVPKTLVFEGGELKAVGKGRMFEADFREFLATGVQPAPKAPDPVAFAKAASIGNLEKSLFEAYQTKLKAEYVFSVFQTEWNKRLKEAGLVPFE